MTRTLRFNPAVASIEEQNLQEIADAVAECCIQAGISTQREYKGVHTKQDILLYLKVFEQRFRQERLYNYRPTR